MPPYGPQSRSPLERILQRVSYEDHAFTTPCWIWTGAGHKHGYGQLRYQGRTYLAHRFSFEHHYGFVPRLLDHLCDVRLCVNPNHLQPSDNRSNVLRGEGPTAINAAKTHCVRGHPFSGQNLIVSRHGRRCRACKNLRQAKYDREARARANSA